MIELQQLLLDDSKGELLAYLKARSSFVYKLKGVGGIPRSFAKWTPENQSAATGL